MFIPFVTTRKPLSPRRGGGGHSGEAGGGGESGGSSSSAGEAGTGSSSTGSTSSEGEGGFTGSSSSSGSSSGSSGSTSSGGTTKSSPVSISGTTKSATPHGPGGGSAVSIPAGQPFSGRVEGGGTRAQIFGTQTYGSGYPGISTGRGVNDRGFPFFFWPLSFGRRPGYLNSNNEYGHASNSTRPGGAMTTASFSSTAANGSVFRILADSATTTSLISEIFAACSTHLNSSLAGTVAIPYDDTSDAPPQPEQVIQYYRASSIALSLDGYNNTAVFGAEGTPDVPLPASVDTTLQTCLNQTIGSAAPLIDAETGTRLANGGEWAAVPNGMGLLGLMLGVWLSSAFV